jgi:hypothetical protein
VKKVTVCKYPDVLISILILDGNEGKKVFRLLLPVRGEWMKCPVSILRTMPPSGTSLEFGTLAFFGGDPFPGILAQLGQ